MRFLPTEGNLGRRGICVMLVLLSVLGAAVRSVDLGLCLCEESAADLVDACCPVEAPASYVAGTPSGETLDRGDCVEVRLTAVETMADASRVSTGLVCPAPLPLAFVTISVSESGPAAWASTARVASPPLASNVPLRI